jgi:hypothetical protein
MNKITCSVCLAVLIAFSVSAHSQAIAPQTPLLGVLAESAGAFLGSLEYIRVFKSSDCGYALTRSFPSTDEALAGEVMPAFPPDARSEVAKSMREIRPELSRQANQNVGKMLWAVKQDHDRNTACGLLAGTLAGVYGRAYDTWSLDKKRYGWKGR